MKLRTLTTYLIAAVPKGCATKLEFKVLDAQLLCSLFVILEFPRVS